MKVGDYVRLDRCQGINRIEGITIDYVELEQYVADEYGEATMILRKNDIIKSSPNIIDLIEVGDYVNGCFVLEKDSKFIVVNGLDNYGFGQGVIPIEDIKSIVTKEQFSSMEYKVGE